MIAAELPVPLSVPLPVPLPKGSVTVPTLVDAPVADPWAVLVLAHGAGANKDHAFLTGFAEALAAEGVTVVRFDFPYAVAGRRMPGPAAHAIATWVAVMDAVASVARATEAGPLRVFAGGKSYGGRMASMAAAAGDIDPAGLVYLGYPFHPPGAPDKPRADHLPAITQPQLFVEGDADPFIQPVAQFEAAVATCRDAHVHWIAGGGHSYEVKGAKRPAGEVGAALAPSVAAWLRPVAQRPLA